MLPSVPPFKKIKTENGEATTLPGEVDAVSANASVKRKIAQKQSSAPMLSSRSSPISDYITTNLLDLNDDCLYRIFVSKNVSAVDLSWVAQTCTKLKGIATEIFERSYKICNFNDMAVADSLLASVVLNTFGPFIVELRIDGESFALGRVFDSIIQSCSCLKSLSIRMYDIPENEISKMALLFGKLEVLRLTFVNIEGHKDWNYDDDYVGVLTPNGNLLDLFSNCKSLIDFEVFGCEVLERSIFESCFPKLQHFEYRLYTDRNIEGFIFRHKNLKSLTLDAQNSYFEIPNTSKVIAANCKRLEKLGFFTDANPQNSASLKCLEKLEYLRELTIMWEDQSMPRLLNESQWKSLQVLHLLYVLGGTDLIPAISRIKTLRVLKLSYIEGLRNLSGLGDMTQLIELLLEIYDDECRFDLVKLVERLVNLKKFNLTLNEFCISKHLYSELVKVVQNRPVAANRYLELCCLITDDLTLSPAVTLLE